MKAIVTVVGKDQVGIIAGVCNRLAEHNINVLDILGIAVAHKGPAVYKAHTVNISEKMAHGSISPFKMPPSTAVMRTGRRQLCRFSPGADTSM